MTLSREGWKDLGHMDIGHVIKPRFYIKGPVRALVALEPRPDLRNRLFWHASVSCIDRLPTWEEITDTRYSLLPLELTFAQILPPPKDYVNDHPFCLHLWEVEWKSP